MPALAAPAALLSLALAAIAAAAPSKPGAAALPPTPAPTSPAVLAIDPHRSGAVFRVQLRARHREVEGRLVAPRGELSGSAQAGWTVHVRVDGRSLRVDGPPWMERTTRSDAFLAVNRHPAIAFVSARFDDAVLHAGGELPGQLTLRGLTRPVSLRLLPSDCARPGQDCDIHVQGELSRKDFGMTAYRAFLRDGVEVRFRVRLRGGAAP
jgi:polyisoprenoid-binding protein YceI